MRVSFLLQFDPIFSPPQTIDNTSGKLCGHYPASIIILVAHNNTKRSENIDKIHLNSSIFSYLVQCGGL